MNPREPQDLESQEAKFASVIPDSMIWDRILLALLVIVGVYGLALVLAGRLISGTVFEALGFGLEDGDIMDGSAEDYVTFVYGVLGSVIMGWMALVWVVAAGPLRRRESWAWTAIVAALAVWFAFDTGLSLVRGYLGHALFNVGFALALAVPLAALHSQVGPISSPSTDGGASDTRGPSDHPPQLP